METLAELPDDLSQIVYVLLYDLRPVLVRLLGLRRFLPGSGFIGSFMRQYRL
jgi:hypothetical protein